MSATLNGKTEVASQDTVDEILEAVGGGGSHATLFTGDVWYTDAGQPNNDGDGKTPETAKQTIAATIALMSAGDKFVTKAGTYAENVVIALASTEWEPEIGTIIAPATGVPITVSGHYCKISMPDGSLFVTGVAGETGVLWSGNRGYPSDIRVDSGSIGTLGFDLTGNGIAGKNLRCANPLTAAFKISGDRTKLDECCTGGEPANTSIGYWVTGSCDKPRLVKCGSQGHINGGYVVDAGVTNGASKGCSSGGGDGPKIDLTNAFVWSDYTFDSEAFKTITFAGAPTTYNIFKLTGAVRISDIHGHVDTPIANTASTLYLELYSTNGDEDITDSPGPNIQALVAGAILVRNADSANDIAIGNPNGTPVVVENSNVREPKTAVDIVADNGATTYIRAVISVALASGSIHWHAHYDPLSDDGFLEAA